MCAAQKVVRLSSKLGNEVFEGNFELDISNVEGLLSDQFPCFPVRTAQTGPTFALLYELV